ncbi:translation initiation factor IF-2 subunit alpha [archaeon]|nr:translation initiation factor IF-2 subunit alpha [archaeon]|tara:strand:+ start:368 stop:1147 length:780 start_codon:yes stop_codon:yes gene_type:complete
MYKKPGFPEENEIVMCTVKKILYNSVFADLDQYNQEGLIHISEIAPGRIRNIRDYVKDGKKIVCKVLRVNEQQKNLELSLRRVSQAQRINKNKEYKQEIRSEKLLNLVAKKLKISLEDIYKKAGYTILEEFELLSAAFDQIVAEDYTLDDLNIDKKIAKEIVSIVKEKVKLPEVTISGKFNLESTDPNGIQVIKKTLTYTKTLPKDSKIKINYLGAPNYKISITSQDYKTAEAELKSITESTIQFIKKLKGSGSFSRDK